MGVTNFEEGAGFGARLLEEILDERVDELGNQNASEEEHGLELAAEDEVGDEAGHGNEDWDQGNPSKEQTKRVSPRVSDVGQRHRLQRWRRHL